MTVADPMEPARAASLPTTAPDPSPPAASVPRLRVLSLRLCVFARISCSVAADGTPAVCSSGVPNLRKSRTPLRHPVLRQISTHYRKILVP